MIFIATLQLQTNELFIVASVHNLIEVEIMASFQKQAKFEKDKSHHWGTINRTSSEWLLLPASQAADLI